MTASRPKRPRLEQPDFLPMSREEMKSLGWPDLDVLLVSGDAYVDHPSFGVPLIGRWLIAHGYKVGISAQPRWDTPEDVKKMGRPRLFAGVTAGALDSMLAHYTAFRKKRSDDAYTPGGLAGARPNRASIVYTGLVKQAFPGLPVILGGIEASLRRIVHYDFWSDRLRRPIVLDSKADAVVYGMAERTILAVAERLEAGEAGTPAREILFGLPGLVTASDPADIPGEATVIVLPSLEEITQDPVKLVDSALIMERQVHQGDFWVVQSAGGRTAAVAPPAEPLSTEELDRLYDLPFSRQAHPSYKESIPAEETVRFSLTTHRGCGGGCTFCSLALHQGRRVRSRSKASIMEETARLKKHPLWRGSISDVGGPSANMWGARCLDFDNCRRTSCLFPEICPKFSVQQMEIIGLLKALKNSSGVKHVRVASGMRHDLALREPAFLEAILAEFAGGQLKAAPEHISPPVLKLMRKPGPRVWDEFLKAFEIGTRAAGKRQFIVPYLMSAFPGCTDQDMKELAEWLKKRGWRPRQVQCFIPTPGSAATAMYYSGRDLKGRSIKVARSDAERLRQHHLLVPGSLKKPGHPKKIQKRGAKG